MNCYIKLTCLLFLTVPSLVLAKSTDLSSLPHQIKFTFNPPDGAKVQTTYTMLRTKKAEGQPQITDEVELKTEGNFVKTNNGFQLHQKTLSSSVRRNGELINDPITNLLSQATTTSIISRDAELVDIEGLSKVEELAKSQFSTSEIPAQLLEVLSTMLSKEGIVRREQAEWNARYAEYAGATIKIGDVFESQAAQALPSGGEMLYTIRTTFPRWESCPVGHCIRIEQSYSSDDTTALNEMTNNLSKHMMQTTVPKNSANSHISGSLSRLIDPSTMLIYSERVERTMTLQMPISDQVILPVVQHETRSYTYTYDRP